MKKIEEIFSLIERELDGQTAFVQVQIGGEYYSRRIGGGVLPDHPHANGEIERSPLWSEWMEEQICRAAVTDGTKENHRNCLMHLNSYREGLTVADITPELVAVFSDYLSDCGLKVNTVAKVMKVFRRYVNVAISEDVISSDPFRKYHIRKEQTKKQSLSERQLRKIEEYNGTETEMVVVRAFLLSCYTGLRFSDVRKVCWQDIRKAGRHKWLVVRMQKTGGDVRIPIDSMFGGKAMELVTTRGRLFPDLPPNSRTNILLQRVIRKLHIRKHISFHCGRVTCATILIHRGMPITTIQHILGHRSVNTTPEDAHVLDETILRDVRRAYR